MADDARRAIAWFRRDLRLTDNAMLAEATARAARVWPVLVADPALLERHAAARGRTAWFGASVDALDAALRDAGSSLTVLHGPPERVLREFAATVAAEVVFAAADEDPDGVARDRRVAASLPLRLVDDLRIVPPGQLRPAGGESFSVYTPFRRALEARVEADPSLLARHDADLSRLAPPALADGAEARASFPGVVAPHPLPDAGEAAAAARLRAFLRAGIGRYRDDRDRPSADGTARLSPDLRVGAISARACWRAATNAAASARERRDRGLARGAAAWRGELAWREFFAHVLAAHPRLASESYRAEYDGIDWVGGPDADELLAAWREGRTGYPFVDAGMRELAATGWMHNRARLVTASFLVKDAGVDWRRGEAVFAERLLDADTQQNGGNWQWVAGVGTDAAPYFRVFTPVLQSRRFDPDGTYIRRWVPELRELADAQVHEPWKAPTPPRTYPGPLVDHAEGRRRTLERYAAVRARSR
jgi:deoxyribodipyrimidine photo-lyase